MKCSDFGDDKQEGRDMAGPMTGGFAGKLVGIRKRIAFLAVVIAGIGSSALGVGWILPTGFVDELGRWQNEPLAYDNSTITYARETWPLMGWSGPLRFTLSSPVNTSRIRVYSDFGFSRVDQVRVEIRHYPSGTWETVHEGAITHSTWYEIEFTASTIDAARYTFHYINTSWRFWLYEFQIYEDPPQVDPGVCETLAATSVEEDAAIMHGQITDDGGEPCEYRFLYGTSESYTASTPWTGSKVVGDAFSVQLTGLSSNTTYHFQAQIRNSAGISAGEDMSFMTKPPGSGWVSPTGHSDPSSAWTNEIFAYDDNTTTLAKCPHDIGDPVWGPWLELTHGSMTADGIRFYGRGGGEVDLM